ncbi:MAG TPA: FtsX-like permease family protein [Gaiellaceae bacterium]|nr:FtsX-like permease family protein [Gaiellaceae bacterium]
MNAILAYALARLRVRRGRVLLAAGGIAAAAAMLGASVTVAYGLATGFDRTAARAHLPDILATFDPQSRESVARVVSSLANVKVASYRLQADYVSIGSGNRFDGDATVIGLPRDGTRGYAIVSGRALEHPDEALVEQGLARSWHLGPGARLEVSGERLRIVGVAVAPDNVAYPLARRPRVWLSYRDAAAATGTPLGVVNSAVVWLVDPKLAGVTLDQARSAALGVQRLRFTTRAGLHVLIGQAAGIVIALLVSFSLIALVVAGTMLAASANAEVQRRLEGLGLLRAIGASPRAVVAAAVVEAVAVALPAGALGVLVGWALVASPLDRLLGSLSQLGPGASVAPLLLGVLLGLVALVALASAWPAWRATRGPAGAVLRRGDVTGSARRLPGGGGPAGLGVRMALLRPARTAGGIVVLGSAVVVILLILSIAALLLRLDRNPVAVGKRYQLTASAPAFDAAQIARLPGVEAAAPRYELSAADSFDLGEAFTVIAFPGDHTRFEAPPLAEGRRLRGPREAEVGLGLAQVLNLSPGATLAAQLPSGREARFRVVGIVRALERQGRVAYVQPQQLGGEAPEQIAIRLRPSASASSVRRELRRAGVFSSRPSHGITGQSVQGWASRSSGFIDVLVALLRTVAVIDALVCLYAIAQLLALTVQERRSGLATVRALGGGTRQLGSIVAFAAAPVVLAAVVVGLAAERWLVGPAVARLAASYVSLTLAPSAAAVAVTAAGLVAGAAVTVLWATRLVTRGPVVGFLRER